MEEKRGIVGMVEEKPTIELVTSLREANWGDPDDCDPDGGWCVPNSESNNLRPIRGACSPDCSPVFGCHPKDGCIPA